MKAARSCWLCRTRPFHLVENFSSVPSPKYGDNLPERGARLARREERAYREYVSDEQRRQTGCPARQMSPYFGFGTPVKLRLKPSSEEQRGRFEAQLHWDKKRWRRRRTVGVLRVE